uniref:Uncharacterized protein n=1 Tax=Solanum tuberosum TaxID=4113 RepID=M1D3V2_SOLTU
MNECRESHTKLEFELSSSEKGRKQVDIHVVYTGIQSEKNTIYRFEAQKYRWKGQKYKVQIKLQVREFEN